MGPNQCKILSCNVANLTPEEWAAAAKVHKYEADFESATLEAMRLDAMHFLQITLEES